MSALKLIANYESESEDLSDSESCAKRSKVELSHSDSEVKRQKLKGPINKRLPLPSVFNKKKDETQEHIDDPAEHQGRVRRYPHERGNWSTFVYFPYLECNDFLKLVSLLQEECNKLDTFNTPDDFHISVSRTFILRFHWINTFIASLRENLQNICKFLIEFDSVKIYTNDDDSRTFVGLKVNFGSKQLYEIVQKVDDVLKEFHLPLFYDNPSFHISILWCSGNKKKDLESILPKLQLIVRETLDKVSSSSGEGQLHQIYMERVICKTGNKVFTFDLK